MSDIDSDKHIGIVNGQRVLVDEQGNIKARLADDGEQIRVDKKKPAQRKKVNGRQKAARYLRLGVVLILGFLAVKFLIIPFFETGGGMADTREVPGDATRFDPIANFATIKAYAGSGAQLTGMDAYYVRSDGTLDLTADYYPRVDLDFVIPTTAPANAPPIGAGGSADGEWYIPVEVDIFQPGQWRKVSSSGRSYTYMNRGMQRDVEEPTSSERTILPDPACSFADLWAVALTKDAPSGAVAMIDYDASGYRFYISDVSISLQFDMDCQLIEY
jgi:hypothetical protein